MSGKRVKGDAAVVATRRCRLKTLNRFWESVCRKAHRIASVLSGIVSLDDDDQSVTGFLSQFQPPNEATVEHALGQPDLIDCIVNYAIHDSRDLLDRETICALRLTQRKWLDAVNRVLRFQREPLIELNLTSKFLAGAGTLSAKNGLILRNFEEAVKLGFQNMAPGAPPTFSLALTPEFFSAENYDTFCNFLRTCAAESLVGLHLSVPANGGTFPFTLPHVTLPLVAKLSVHIMEADPRSPCASGNSTITVLLQWLLSCCSNLKELMVPSSSYQAPPQVEYLSMPNTLTCLCLGWVMTEKQLELLSKVRLPCLRNVELLLSEMPNGSVLLGKFLFNHRATLHIVAFNGARRGAAGEMLAPVLVKFPRSESLKFLISCCDLVGSEQDAEEVFPKLQFLLLEHQIQRMMERWTRQRLTGVTAAHVDMVVEERSPSHIHHHHHRGMHTYSRPVDLAQMVMTQRAYPNLTHLSVVVSASTSKPACHLIFRDMTQLKHLVIKLEDQWDWRQFSGGHEHWDSLLMGVQPHWVRALRRRPFYWCLVDLAREEIPSIRRLRNLECLYLEAPLPRREPRDYDKSLLSDLCYEFALLKLNHLHTLNFVGSFMTSDFMIKKWRDSGRTYYDNEPDKLADFALDFN